MCDEAYVFRGRGDRIIEGDDEMSESEWRGGDGGRREGRRRRIGAIAKERCRTSRCSDVSLVSLAARLVGWIRANAMCNDASPSGLAMEGSLSV